MITDYKMAQQTDTNTTTAQLHLGCVKWFNNKRGYGFITYKDGDTDHDIFVHHSGIQPLTSQYRTLTTGEYVSFSIKEATNENERNQAVTVTGVNGGPLLCDQYSKKRSYANYDENQNLDESSETKE